ncbi:ATP-binding protein [Demequina sp.]|uniref:ATP-binding protein n=1 Tax=Demequina sp. TaxID=2050685 RepID=UPI003A84B01A
MLQRLGIRGKLLAVVAVPILVLVLAAGFITFGSVQDLNTARNAEQLIDTLDRARSLEDSLQAEREATANYVSAYQDTTGVLDDARDYTDTALDQIDQALAAVDEEDQEGAQEIQDRIDSALSRSGSTYLADARSYRVTSATEESEGWLVFPSADDVAAMQALYADAVEDLNAVAADVPDSYGIDVLLSTLTFRVNSESTTATQLFTEPLEYKEAMINTAGRVDQGIAALLGTSTELATSEGNMKAVEALLAGQDLVARLPEHREDAMAATIHPTILIARYTAIIDLIVSAADDVAVAMTDRDLVATVQAYGDADALVEDVLHEEVVIGRLLRAGAFLPGELANVQTMAAQTDIALADMQDSASGLEPAVDVPDFGASESNITGDTGSFESIRDDVLTGQTGSLFNARDAGWSTQVDEELAVYEPIRDQLWSDVESRASSNAQAAVATAILTAIVAVLVVVASIVVALLIARLIVAPLRRLTTTATAVRQELPRLVERVAIPGEQVDVSEVQIAIDSRDEIGTLAEAFNGVNAATLAIAAEQAALRGSISEMFVNVARRDQVLLNRQLKSIDEMERTEDDPDTLTRLFALDHLATRMRRNSESLLVLAGIDTGRRLRRPMPLSDVIRTASSEIELYERVQLELDVDPSMLGHSALTAAHMFAELLENATVFSDPGSPVVVRTRADEAGFAVEIEDYGIGMTESELADANDRVASTAASEILGAQRLGLFVVGRIARRVGARVSVSSQEGKGTIAVVTLPASLFATDETPVEHVSSTAVDPATHAPTALVTHDVANEITSLPSRVNAATDAYKPTVIEEGASLLSGRGGEAPAQPMPSRGGAPAAPAAEAESIAVPADSAQVDADLNSIEALIAADAAQAPTAEQTNPEELTEGVTGAGLPTRRRREAPAPADAERDATSIVGLPARATDAQLSALEAEQVGGFMPTVAPSEVAPQSVEERSSMFRGFRSRKDTEAAASLDPDAESLGHAARRGGIDAAEIAAAHQGEPSANEPLVPGLEPDQAPVDQSGHGADAAAGIAAGAAAFGAAAFFGSRRDQAEPVSEPVVESATEAVPEPALEPEAFEPVAASPWAPSPELPEPAADAFAPVDEAPSAAEQAPWGQYQEAQASLDETDEVIEQADEPVDEVPTFRMPSWFAAGAATTAVAGANAARSAGDDDWSAEDSAQSEDQAAFDVAEPAATVEPEPSVPSAEPAAIVDDAPFVIPMLEGDEPAAAQEDTFGDDSYGVDAVSLAEDVPAAESDQPFPWAQPLEHQPAPFESVPSVDSAVGFDSGASYEPAAPVEPALPWAQSVAQPEVQPAAPFEPQPAAHGQEPPAQASAPGFGAAFGTQAATPVTTQEPAPVAASASPAPSPAPSLDDLIKGAVDDDAEERPSFFTRLFGRGNRKAGAEPTTESALTALAAGAGVAAGGRAAAASQPVAPSQPSATAFLPVAEQAPVQHVADEEMPEPDTSTGMFASLYRTAPSAHSAPVAPSVAAVEPEPAPAATSFAPSQPAEPVQASQWERAVQDSAPAPWEQAVQQPAPAPWHEAPTSFNPEPQQSAPAEAFPAQPAGASAAWAPAQETSQPQQPGYFTPDQLAQPAGWEAAGASALQAAEPEVATSYQPVIQPDLSGGNDADVTSAVFSELSSLASSRPKVEKTRAGLQRRRPSDAAPVEVKPLEEAADLAPKDRDAEAVRHRFSSFYSGTKRARDDVAAFEHQVSPAEANET